MSSRLVIFVAMCSLQTGCAGLVVTDDKDPSGIPFYAKQAVVVQETKVQTFSLVIHFELADEKGGKAVAIVPDSGPISIQENAANALAVSMLAATWDGQTGPDKAALTDSLLSALTSLAHIATKIPDPGETIENTWKIDTVIGPKRYYIRTRAPLVGTATSDFTLNGDGTLSKATSTVTDQTLSTLLSPVPLTSFFTAGPSTTQKAQHATSGTGTKKKPKLAGYFVRLVVVEVPNVYTLQRVSTPPIGDKFEIGGQDSCDGTTCRALTLSDARDGLNGVQLVSLGHGDDNKPKSTDKGNVYQISGSITPPTPPDKK